MKSYALAWLLFSVPLWASSPQEVSNEVIKLLPTELTTLTSSQTKQELEKKFKSKIKIKDDKSLHLAYNSKFVDVTINLKNNHFTSILYHAPDSLKAKTSDLYQKAWSVLSEQDKDKIEKEMDSPTHSAGSVISIELPGQNMKLEFANNEQKTLQSITILDKKGKK